MCVKDTKEESLWYTLKCSVKIMMAEMVEFVPTERRHSLCECTWFINWHGGDSLTTDLETRSIPFIWSIFSSSLSREINFI